MIGITITASTTLAVKIDRPYAPERLCRGGNTPPIAESIHRSTGMMCGIRKITPHRP